MKPEDVPAELVEAAQREYLPGLYDTGEEVMRHTLAAVLPLHEASVLNKAGDEFELPGSDATGYYASEHHAGYQAAESAGEAWLWNRAARLREGSQ